MINLSVASCHINFIQSFDKLLPEWTVNVGEDIPIANIVRCNSLLGDAERSVQLTPAT